MAIGAAREALAASTLRERERNAAALDDAAPTSPADLDIASGAASLH